ncbi:MAG: type II toxin-antitoxin system Phd/YefM family antitoxin [Planctomycetes bacterium]|nr:type II toxin-antitoxin system Phd/YefM family antitoxin [Planctomycetota bacterium]
MTQTITSEDAENNIHKLLEEVLENRAKFTITKDGKPAATIEPLESEPKVTKISDLKKLIESLPSLGDDAEDFARDVEYARKSQTLPRTISSWE